MYTPVPIYSTVFDALWLALGLGTGTGYLQGVNRNNPVASSKRYSPVKRIDAFDPFVPRSGFAHSQSLQALVDIMRRVIGPLLQQRKPILSVFLRNRRSWQLQSVVPKVWLYHTPAVVKKVSSEVLYHFIGTVNVII